VSEPVFVIAGDYPQAVQWAHEHDVSSRDLVYLASPGDVVYRTAGRRGGVYLCIGTWEDKPAWKLADMFAHLVSRGFTRAAESEWKASRRG